MPSTPPHKKARVSPASISGSFTSNLLPVQEYRYELAEFLKEKKDAPTVIIIGDTGSGKTTQIPQLFLSEAFNEFFGSPLRKIAVTQPRRVAAISVAERVAQEYDCKIGEEVGYSVRFDSCVSSRTKIEYMTDGMLVRQATADGNDDKAWMLRQYNMVILDEVHERSLNTDILLGLVKKAQIRRRKLAAEDGSVYKPLKVIIMSATVEIERMQEFWKDAPVLYVPGRTYPVEIKFAPTPIEDYLYSSLVAIFQIHRSEPPGSILVFLTGSEEIEDLIRRGREIARNLPPTQTRISFVPLYASLPTDMQKRALEMASEQIRKVILATNVAETSLTIPGVKYVIDSGRVKSKQFAAGTGVETLKVQKISQAQAWQRSGRAGREQAGVCYRLYSENEFDQWPLYPVPEIQRCNLSSVVLQLASMGLNRPMSFPFFDAPEAKTIQNSVDELEWLGAVKQEKLDDKPVVKMLDDGKLMVSFPLEPKYSRCLLRAKVHNCMEEMLIVISMLSADSPFYVPIHKRPEAEAAHQKFSSNEGDHVVFLNIWHAYKGTKESAEWCKQNFLNNQNLKTVGKILRQLKEAVLRLKIPIGSCGSQTAALRTALCEGMFMNAAERLPDGSYITVDTRQPVSLHPSSFLFKTKPSCVIYNELVQTTKAYIRTLCLVEKGWLSAVGEEYFSSIRKLNPHFIDVKK